MTVGQRIFVTVMGLLVVCALALVLPINIITHAANAAALKQTEQAMLQLQQECVRDLIAEIRIAVGDSLQPGEAPKFRYIAEQQVALKELRELSFFGPDGRAELSSVRGKQGEKVDPDVWAELQNKRELVVRETPNTIAYYQPLFADRDMVRLHPDWKPDMFFGALHLEFSRDRITAALNAAREQQQSVTRRLTYTAAIAIAAVVALGLAGSRWIALSITERLKRIIAGLSAAARQVASASQQVAHSSQSLSEGATEQASSLEETSASLEEMSAMTRQNTENASQAEATSRAASTDAVSGRAKVEKMSTAVAELKAAADKTEQVIKSIDAIAFQTNLLALNAAVEAARAGDSGRGFAVVAEEVRRLALRSAQAARETSELLQSSRERAEQSVVLTSETVATFTAITGSIKKVVELGGEVASAAQEQSRGIEQINKAVSHLDQVTQSNAATAEECASASEQLSAQAADLQSLVDQLGAMVGIVSQANPSQGQLPPP